MMNKFPQNELLSAYLDDELSVEQRAQVEEWLAASPAARQLLEELRGLSNTLKSLPRRKLGEDISESVLRIAERRMLTEPAEMDTLGPDISDESGPMPSDLEPLSKVILRRLKNPRMWAWQGVIVAVAILLLMYYPNQNQNGPAADNAERTIAMNVSEEDESNAARETPSMQAAPPLDMADQNHAVALDKAAKDTRNESVGFGGMGKTAAKSGSAFVSKKPADGITGISGKSELSLGDKVAANDAPAGATISAAKGLAAPATPVAPGGTDSDGLSMAGNTQFGFKKADAENSRRLAYEGKSAKQPGEKQSGEKIVTGVKAAEELLVVNCEITSEALNNRAFDKLLIDNGIAWNNTPSETPAEENRSKRDALQPPQLAKGGLGGGAAKMEGLARLRETRGWREPLNANSIKTKSPETETWKYETQIKDNFKTEPVEMVYVEASPAQITATLNGLLNQSNSFLTVAVTPTKDDPRIPHFSASVTSGRETSKSDQVEQQIAQQPKKAAEAKEQVLSRTARSGGSVTTLGRAQRLSPSIEHDLERYVPQTFDRKQIFTDANQKASLGVMKDAVSAGASINDALGHENKLSQDNKPIQEDKPSQADKLAQINGAVQPSATAPTEPAQSFAARGMINKPVQVQAEPQPATMPARPSATASQSQTAQQEQPAQGAGIRQNDYSLSYDSQSVLFGTNSSQRLQRVLFVFQVVDGKSKTESSEISAPQNAPAPNSAPANAAPAEAGPAKK